MVSVGRRRQARKKEERVSKPTVDLTTYRTGESQKGEQKRKHWRHNSDLNPSSVKEKTIKHLGCFNSEVTWKYAKGRGQSKRAGLFWVKINQIEQQKEGNFAAKLLKG